MNFIYGNNVKRQFSKIIDFGKFIPLKASSNSVFAYALSYNKQSVIVVGNLDFRQRIDTVVSVPRLTGKTTVIPVKIKDIPIIEHNSLKIPLESGEIIVIYLPDLEVK